MSDDPGASRLSRRGFVRGAAVAGAVAVGVVGAGGGIRPAAPPPRRAAFRPPAFLQGTTLVVALQDGDLEKARPLFNEFGARHNLTIQGEGSPFANLLEKLTIDLTQNTGAFDVVSLDDPWIPVFAEADVLRDLRELMEERGIEPDPDFVPELLALGEFPPESGLRGLPWIGNVQHFAWRADVLGELGLAAPRTWDEVLTNATAITAAKGADGLFGIGLRGQAGNPAGTGFLPVLRGYGSDLFDPNWEPRLETPAARAALATLVALAKQAPPGLENVGHDEHGRDWIEGAIAQSGDVWSDQLLASLDPERSGVTGLIEIGGEPAQVGGQRAHLTGTWLLGIPKGSRNAEAATEFILWLTAPEQQKRLLIDHHLPPTRTSVFQDREAVAKFPFLPALLTACRTAVPRPRTPYHNRVEAIFGRYVAEAIAGQTGGEVALRRANREIRELMVREGVLEEPD